MYKLIKLAFKTKDVSNKEGSEFLLSLCHSVQFVYKNDIVLCYAFIDENLDLNILKNFPLIEFDFELPELKYINISAMEELDYLNGIKERKEIDYGV